MPDLTGSVTITTDRVDTGNTIKAPVEEGGCGVVLEATASKRDFYVGIALVCAPKLVASAVDNAPARRALGSMVSNTRN